MAAPPPKQFAAADVKLTGYSEQQVHRAVASLLKFVGDQKRKGNELFDEDEALNIIIALKKMPMQSRKDKPIPLLMPHPMLALEGAEVCLFVKDHKGEGHKEGKLKMQQYEKNGGVTKVIGISKLRTKYESHEAKRQLCKMYDVFLADERILPSLPKLIGKSFFKKKKQPIPIRITGKDIPSQVKKACSSAYMFKSSGTCINIKVALSSFGPQQIVDNVHAALAQAAQHVPKKWANVRGVFLKTADSVALPLFQCLPDQGVKIAAGVGETARAERAVESKISLPLPAAGVVSKQKAARGRPVLKGKRKARA